MPLRGRRRAGARLAIVATSLLAYLFSAGPAAATVVYCISDDGHAGFEIVASNERGCASCCHDEAEPAHEGFNPSPVECTDIALSSDQAVRAPAGIDKDSLTITPVMVATVQPEQRLEQPTLRATRTADGPPRGSPTVLLRHTVLLI